LGQRSTSCSFNKDRRTSVNDTKFDHLELIEGWYFMTDGEAFSCPECGGPLTPDGKSLTIVCPFCGASVIVPESLRPKPAPATTDALKEMAASATGSKPAPASPNPARKTSRIRRIFFYIPLAVVVLVSLGLIVFSNYLSGNGQSALSQVSGPVDTPTPPAFRRSLNASLPRQVTYAGLIFTLTQGEIDNQDLSSEPPVNLKDQAFARLSFKLSNTSQQDIYLSPDLFKLRMSDGNDYTLEPGIVLDNDFRAPPPRSTSTTKLIFPVPSAADWNGAILTIGDPTSEPATLPLSGEIPTPAYPAQLRLPENPQASAQGLDYLIQSATLDLDSDATRADLGKRFLKLEMKITDSGLQYGANVSQDNFRLIVDGEASGPQDAPIEVIDYKTSLTGEVVFPVPVGANRVILQVGDVTSDQNQFGQIQLDLTKTTPPPPPSP
jgi:uncharacterized Zn finger protein (UPF0148 family)